MGLPNIRRTYALVSLCAVMRSAWCFPLFQPVIVLPAQNYMPFQVPIVSSVRHAALNDYRNSPPSIRETYQQAVKQAVTSNDHQAEYNGHQNPQSNYERSTANEIQEQTINEDDTVNIEAASEPFPGTIVDIDRNDGKFSVGEIIMGIPWLPFEVNVPDTIAWIYNGIAGVIGGIGQRIPFISNLANESFATQP